MWLHVGSEAYSKLELSLIVRPSRNPTPRQSLLRKKTFLDASKSLPAAKFHPKLILGS
jgi:hypothetical protein